MPDAVITPRSLRDASSRLVDFWSSQPLRNKWVAVLLALFIAGLCIARAYAALIASEDFTTDAFMIFDGAWRILNGQRPHTDFYSHLGFLTYAPEVVGLWISRGTAYSFGYSQALVAALLGGWAFLLARRRMFDIPTILFTLAIVIMAVAPFAPGFPPLNFGAGMVYNRWGYALLALIFLEGFGGHKRLSSKDELWGGISTGIVLAFSFFLKITVVVAAILLLIALIPRRSQLRIRWTGIIAAMLLVSLPFAFYYRFQISPLVHDLTMVARAKHIPWRTYQLDGMIQHIALMIVLAVLAASIYAAKGARSVVSILVAGIAISIAGVAMLLGDHEYTGFPLAAFFSIVLCDAIAASGFESSLNELRAAVLMVASVSVIALLAGGVMGISYGVLERVRGGGRSARLDTPAWEGFSFTGDDKPYADFFNDGYLLLRKNRRDGETVLPLHTSDPFSYGLGIKPSRGGAMFLQYRTTFSDNSRPLPEWLVGQADLVLVPIGVEAGTIDQGLMPYLPYIKSHYSEIGVGRYWRLFRRRPAF